MTQRYYNDYRGRFAPSPTGPLHFGSLSAAVASFLQARACGGRWLLRIEDVDVPRVVPGAADNILRSLERLGMYWDEAVWYQSTRTAAYEAALAQLQQAHCAYGCACSRREIADSSVTGIDGAVYPGTCRDGPAAGRAIRAWRVDTRDAGVIEFDDLVFGPQRQDLTREVGDVVVRRADGLFAYQLAVVVDDAAQGINEVVRGADLLDSTARQIHLQRLLQLPTPRYAHLPVAVNAHGEKLSKQTYATPIDVLAPAAAVRAALGFLHQAPPPDIGEALTELWSWAISHWRLAAVPAQRSVVIAQ